MYGDIGPFGHNTDLCPMGRSKARGVAGRCVMRAVRLTASEPVGHWRLRITRKQKRGAGSIRRPASPPTQASRWLRGRRLLSGHSVGLWPVAAETAKQGPTVTALLDTTPDRATPSLSRESAADTRRVLLRGCAGSGGVDGFDRRNRWRRRLRQSPRLPRADDARCERGGRRAAHGVEGQCARETAG